MSKATSPRKRRAISAILTGESKTIKDAMLIAGYSETSARHNTDIITQSKEYKEIIENYGITLPSIAKRHSQLLQSTDEKVAMQAVQTGYKVHGVYEKGAGNTFNAPIMIQINPPEVPKEPATEPYTVVDEE